MDVLRTAVSALSFYDPEFQKNDHDANLHKAFRLLTRAGLNTSQAIERIEAEVGLSPEIQELIAFIASSSRGIVK